MVSLCLSGTAAAVYGSVCNVRECVARRKVAACGLGNSKRALMSERGEEWKAQVGHKLMQRAV